VLDATPDWAWGGATGRGVRVAVVDSGIEASHPALQGCVDVEASVAVRLDGGRAVVEPAAPEDAFGHGTACAGIIHALAPDARITSVAVLGPHLSGKAGVFHKGVTWAVESGFDVINLSLGTGRREWALAFYELCDWAYFRNAVLVTAANNRPRPAYPSLYASVLSVAACDVADDRALYWNATPPTEFLARGISMEVAWRGGTRIVITGNSFAAPHVAGLAALVRSKHPELRPAQVKAVLAAASLPMTAATDAAPGRFSGATREPSQPRRPLATAGG
jgi:subtilisin family serine protease